jgi:hypothetical protein
MHAVPRHTMPSSQGLLAELLQSEMHDSEQDGLNGEQ